MVRDQPKGYIQRVALGVFGFSLFGTCLGNLGFFANDDNYRPYLILVILSVEMNDVFAYVIGKSSANASWPPTPAPRRPWPGRSAPWC